MPGDAASQTGPLITYLYRNVQGLQPQWLPLILVCFTVVFLQILLLF